MTQFKEINIDGSLDLLSVMQKHILICRFGLRGDEPMTLQEVASEYDLTRERIRQIEQEALKILRSPKALRVLTKSTDETAPSRK
jgi:DNA-directed RNA polymerase sigma subunit (sigma70/sigma32)